MNINFPNRFTFLLLRNIETGEQRVSACVNKLKCRLENVKYRDVQHYSWETNERVTTLAVKEFESEKVFTEYLAKLTEEWTVKK